MEFSSCYFLAILCLSWLCALENPYCQLHILDIGPAIDKIVVIFCTDWPGTRAAITMTEKGMRGGGHWITDQKLIYMLVVLKETREEKYRRCLGFSEGGSSRSLPPVRKGLSLSEGKFELQILSILALLPLKTRAALKARSGLERLVLVAPCQRGCPSSLCNHPPEKDKQTSDFRIAIKY